MCREKEYAQALLDANQVAERRGEKFGLCDAIDNAGNPYQSKWLEELLEEAINKLKLLPTGEGPIGRKWSTAFQWEEKSGGCQ